MRAPRSLLAAALVTGLAGCAARNRAAQEPPQDLLASDEEEIALGRDAVLAIDASIGLYPDEELSSYVEGLGLRMAARSNRSALPWRFEIVDSPVVNAFALPGGTVYLTRGLLAYVASEAALAGVLGHEIGHVTARHVVEARIRQQAAAPEVDLGTIFFPEARPYRDVLGGGLGPLFVEFGRDSERQADDVAVRYSLEQGYDPAEMVRLIEVLDRRRDSERDIPGWASTHPAPEDRETALLALAAAPRTSERELTVGAETYGRHIDGLVFGDDPRQGFLSGRRFVHPALRYEVEIPEGWRVRRTRQAMYAAPPDGSAAVKLTVSSLPAGTSLEMHARELFARRRLEHGTGVRRRIGPFDAYYAPFRVLGASGELLGEAAFIADGARVYEIFGFTRPDAYRAAAPVLLSVIGSFSRLRDRDALAIQPLRVRLFEATEPMSLREVLRRAGSDPEHDADAALMNQLDLEASVEPGRLLKVLRRGES